MDYSTKCRLCLEEIVKHEGFVPLYTTGKNDLTKQLHESIVLMISYCVSVQIENITALPAHICLMCFNDLKKYNDFKKKCQKSDEELRKFASERLTVQVKEEPDVDDNPILPLLTPLVTLTEGVNTPNNPKLITKLLNDENVNGEHKKPETERKKGTDEGTKIRIKNVTELNGKSEIESESSAKNQETEELDEDAPLSEILHGLVKKECKKGKYQCSYCDETFRRQVAKQVHEKEHKVLYKCVLCYESFHTYLKLQKHRADVHNEDPYCCSFCSKTFSDVHTWIDHLKKTHVCCSKCKSYFKTQGDMDNHTCLKKAQRSKGCSPEEPQNRIQYDFPNRRGQYRKGKFAGEKKKYTPKKNYYQLKKMRLLAAAQSTEFVTVDAPQDDKFLTEESKRGPFPCFRCDKDFTDKGSLICHQAVAHPGQPIDNTQRPPKKSVLFCKFCLSFFRHVSDMNAHFCHNKLYSKRSSPLGITNTTSSQSLHRAAEPDDKTVATPLSLIRKSFSSLIKGEPHFPARLQDSIEKKPVVSKLLPTSSISKLFNETDVRIGSTYSISSSVPELYSPIPTSNEVMIKEERIDYDDEEEERQELQIANSPIQHLRPGNTKKRKGSESIEQAESVFKVVNPNILATLGIRQDTSL